MAIFRFSCFSSAGEEGGGEWVVGGVRVSLPALTVALPCVALEVGKQDSSGRKEGCPGNASPHSQRCPCSAQEECMCTLGRCARRPRRMPGGAAEQLFVELGFLIVLIGWPSLEG